VLERSAMGLFSMARLRAIKFIMILAALAWWPGPVRLDRVEDGAYAVFLVGSDEIEVVVPFSDAVAALAEPDEEAQARIAAKLEELRARGGRLEPVSEPDGRP
jgi:hypothetical protein